jgi:hypothetical protein
MRVFGTVKDTEKETPIKGAKVRLSIGEKELAILYTDSDGKFEHSSPESYTGEILTFYAEKKGYKSQSSTYEIEGEEVPFDIELVPIVVDSLWKKLKRWFVKNKKWVAIGAGIVVIAILIYRVFPPPNGKGPDLVISKIEISPATPVVNNKVTFKVHVKNKGNAEAGPSKLSFKVGGESRPPITVVPSLGPGQEHIYTRIDTLTVAQNYRATAIADAEEDVDESNENNNVGTKDFTVVKLEVAKPDLIISNIEISPASPTVNELITFKVHVRNIGNARVSSSKLRFRVDGLSSTPINVIYEIRALAAGEEYIQIRGNRLSVAQDYKLTATADYDEKVKESNENNNVKTKRFKVVSSVLAPTIQEDCISFDWRRAEAKVSGGMWKIIVGDMALLAFPNESEARKALSIIKHYRMNSQCFVGRPDASMEYYLVDGKAPSGSFSGEDCLSCNYSRIEVKKVSNRWKIVEGSSLILDFGSSQAEAKLAYEIIKKYKFTKICYVGRPDASMIYLRR